MRRLGLALVCVPADSPHLSQLIKYILIDKGLPIDF
jgi:hypothetical protein